jgi:hypothetical protein
MGLFPVLVYLALCVLVGVKGMDTRLGFWGTSLLSLILTPLIVFIALVMFEGQPRRKA